MSYEAIEEVIGQGPNLQNDVPEVEGEEEAYGAEGDDNGGQPEGNGDQANDGLDNNQVGETPPPRAPTPMTGEDHAVPTEPQGDNPSVSRPPTPEESGEEEEGDAVSPPKKVKY